MKVAIHTLGTRGDIQPYLALALGLRSQGHEVMLAAPSQFEAFVGVRGITFAHLPGDFLELLEAPETKAAMAGGGGFAAGFKLIRRFRLIGRKQLAMEWAADQQFGPELIIYHPKALGAPHIAEKLACPAVLASPLPGFTPTREFASPLVPFASLGPLNRLSHSVMTASGIALFRDMISRWRVAGLGLPPLSARSLPPKTTLYAYSPHVLPVPGDWGDDVAVTGYWFLEDGADWVPDPELRAFLEAGEPPVYVGFGSMPDLAPRELTQLVVEALALAGRRGVLAIGGGAMQEVAGAGHVHFVNSAPHDRLFPMMSACVHHGGAGTTAASLRAGKPTVVCPFFGDQPFWGRRVQELGVGPAPIEKKELTASRLAAAIVETTAGGEMQRRAAKLAADISGENGVGNAICFLKERGLLL